MAGAAGPVRRASRGRAVLYTVFLLLAAACVARCDGEVEVDDKGAELPPKRFPSGPNLDKLRLHLPEPAPPAQPALSSDSVVVHTNHTKGLGTTLLPGAANDAAANVTVVGGPGAPPSAATARPFLEPTKSAGVLVAVFVCVALGGYFGLLVWRRVLERKYGNREILVNEEHFEHDSRDLRNFQL